MPWSGATYSTSYQEIMSHLFDNCRLPDGSVSESCIQRNRNSIEFFDRLSKRARAVGMDAPSGAEQLALQNYLGLKEQRPTQTQILLGPFEKPADLYAMKTRGRVSVHYGDAMSTSQDVKVEGPHGISREFHTDDPREKAFIHRAAESLFTGNEDMEQTRKLMEYLRQMVELYRRGK